MLKTALTDEETVAKILEGEVYLYESLMRKFNTRLYQISVSIVNDDMEAEDAMQTAYINAFLHLSSFQNKSSFSTWLTRILINESLLHKKRKLKSRKILAGQTISDSHNNTPLKTIMNKELKLILEKAVSNLPEKYRLVFVMREVQELSTNETMEILNLGESNVKIRLTRAKEMLRNELSSYYHSNQLFEFNLIRCDRIVNFVMMSIKARKKNL
ncbi:MAG: polymerase sigma factor, sigma-70 family [Daejeonella sp.]|nr:polymerase sigma factor, sigma-70 family [Daejeonella sp.]